MLFFISKIMEEIIRVSGTIIKCMEMVIIYFLSKEHYFMHQVNLHMKDSGLMINFKGKVFYIMNHHKCYLMNLIMEILIKLESIYF